MAKANGIAGKAMLANLHMARWRAAVRDEKLTEETTERHKMQTGSGHFYKRLVSTKELLGVTGAYNAARHYHWEHTLPWSDTGQRILPSNQYFTYISAMMKHRQEFEAAVAHFVSYYETFVLGAGAWLGDAYDASEYPSASEVESKFAFSVDILPMPDAADFRVSLGEAEVEKIRQGIQDRVEEDIQAATSDLFKRAHKVVRHMVTRLQAFETTVEAGKKRRRNSFRDTLVNNVAELATLLPKLNIANDPKLDALCARLNNDLCAYSAEDLRSDDVLRKDVAKSAESILADMVGYVG